MAERAFPTISVILFVVVGFFKVVEIQALTHGTQFSYEPSQVFNPFDLNAWFSLPSRLVQHWSQVLHHPIIKPIYFPPSNIQSTSTTPAPTPSTTQTQRPNIQSTSTTPAPTPSTTQTSQTGRPSQTVRPNQTQRPNQNENIFGIFDRPNGNTEELLGEDGIEW